MTPWKPQRWRDTHVSSEAQRSRWMTDEMLMIIGLPWWSRGMRHLPLCMDTSLLSSQPCEFPRPDLSHDFSRDAHRSCRMWLGSPPRRPFGRHNRREVLPWAACTLGTLDQLWAVGLDTSGYHASCRARVRRRNNPMSSLSPSKGSHDRMLVMVVPALLLLHLAVRSFGRTVHRRMCKM